MNSTNEELKTTNNELATDINRLQKNLIESELALDYATSVANTLHLPLIVLDKKLRLKSANHAFKEKFIAMKPQRG